MLDKLSSGKQKIVVYILLMAVTLAVFWQVHQYNFINIDDDIYITDNIHIQSGITQKGIHWAFSTTYAEFWHPLTWLSLMLDYQVYGLNAGGYHLTNLVLHIISALLLFWLFNRMTGSIWRSAFVAAFFAIHPLRVESVAWVAERKDVLSVFFLILMLCFYVYYTEKPVIKRYLLVLFCFICSLMSKPMVVTGPVIMVLLDYWPLKRFESQKSNAVLWQLKEKALFFILAFIFSIVTLYAQYNPSIKHFPLSYRLANAPVSFVTYLGKIFWPHDLVILYPLPDQLPTWQIIGVALVLIVVGIVLIVFMKRLPYLFIGWLWYLVTLLPVIGITQIGTHSIHDLYTYLPSIGIAVMLAWGIPPLFRSDGVHKKILLPAGIIVLVILSVLTWRQCGYWKDSITLLNRDLQVTNGSIALVHNNIGVSLAEEGKIKEAVYHYNEAIRIKPDYADAYNNRGTIYGGLKQFQLAIGNFDKAIALKSDYAKAFYNRGTAYTFIGQYERAIENYSDAIRLNPDYIDAYYNRAVIYLRQGDVNSGCNDAQKACSLGDCSALKAAKDRGYCR
jgi:tetratricopeptide (TPR) repeat protein